MKKKEVPLPYQALNHNQINNYPKPIPFKQIEQKKIKLEKISVQFRGSQDDSKPVTVTNTRNYIITDPYLMLMLQ